MEFPETELRGRPMNNDVPGIACGGGPVDEKAVSVWDAERGRNVCGLCGSDDLQPGYGLGGGGGIGAYNWCESCQRILDKSEDKS